MSVPLAKHPLESHANVLVPSVMQTVDQTIHPYKMYLLHRIWVPFYVPYQSTLWAPHVPNMEKSNMEPVSIGNAAMDLQHLAVLNPALEERRLDTTNGNVSTKDVVKDRNWTSD